MVHGALSCCYSDLRIPLALKQCSWGFSGVPSRKSRLLSCVMCNTALLCTQCRGIGPHLAARGKSLGFSRVAAGTCGYILELRRGWPFHTRVCSATSGLQPSCEGQLGILLKAGTAIVTPLHVWRETKGAFPRAIGILGLLSSFMRSQASSPF